MQLSWLYRQPVIRRSIALWAAMMAVMWVVFGLGVLTHPEAWSGVTPAEMESGWGFVFYILSRNLFILALIIVGNLFVRFGSVTPGLLILAVQAVMIGWTAGTNAFASPFPSVTAANAAFLRIGLWETMAYALMCAATLTKSLYIADRFPATEWVETRSLRDVRFSAAEWAVAVASLLFVLLAALIEAAVL